MLDVAHDSLPLHKNIVLQRESVPAITIAKPVQTDQHALIGGRGEGRGERVHVGVRDRDHVRPRLSVATLSLSPSQPRGSSQGFDSIVQDNLLSNREIDTNEINTL